MRANLTPEEVQQLLEVSFKTRREVREETDRASSIGWLVIQVVLIFMVMYFVL